MKEIIAILKIFNKHLINLNILNQYISLIIIPFTRYDKVSLFCNAYYFLYRTIIRSLSFKVFKIFIAMIKFYHLNRKQKIENCFFGNLLSIFNQFEIYYVCTN